MNQSKNFTEGLCLECGLCCNGVIFADVRSPEGACVNALKNLGAKPKAVEPCDGTKMFSIGQPCVAFRDMKCQVYSSRPEHCRNFDCLLLEKVKTSERSFSAALKVVRRAHRLAERVGQLMMQLGNTEEHLPMANRFRHVARAMEKPGADAPKNKTYAELTLGYHELTLLLSAEFYQGGH